MPVTISIGISSSFGGLADKDRAARNALDMALQRGGDQVVVLSLIHIYAASARKRNLVQVNF